MPTKKPLPKAELAKEKQAISTTKEAHKQSEPAVPSAAKKASGTALKYREDRNPAHAKSSARDAAKTSAIHMAAANELQKQKEMFEKATKLFNSRNFADAQKLFESAIAGPSIDIAHVARLHVKMCGQRLQKSTVPLDTPEDRYNFAISLINQRTNLDEAERHLKAATQAKENADHFHYALALCLGLNGDFNGCSHHLGRAIALAPNNRSIARNDPDFKEILQAPQLRELFSATK